MNPLGKTPILPTSLLCRLALIADVRTKTNFVAPPSGDGVSQFISDPIENEIIPEQSGNREHALFSPERFELIQRATAKAKQVAETPPKRLYGDTPFDPDRIIVNTPKGYVVNLQHLHQVLLSCFPNANRLASFLNSQVDENLGSRFRHFDRMHNAQQTHEDIVGQWVEDVFSDLENSDLLEIMIDKLIERGPFGLLDTDSLDRKTFCNQLRFLRYSGLDIRLDESRLTNIHIRSIAYKIVVATSYRFDPDKITSIVYGSKFVTPSRADLLRLIVCLRNIIDLKLKVTRDPTNSKLLNTAIEHLKALISKDEINKQDKMTNITVF